MMTTMAALLAGIPLAFGSGHGIGAAAAAGHRDGGRTAGEPGADAVHHAGDLYLLRQAGAALLAQATAQSRRTGDMEPQRGGAAVNISAPFIHRPVATTLLTVAMAIAGAIAFTVLPVSPLPQVDFPTIIVGAGLPGASAEIMASSRGDAAGAAVRAHRRGDGDDLVERAGLDRDHDPVRPEPQHRRGGARRAGGDQRGADVSAGEPAGQPDLSQGEPGGRADHDSGADLATCTGRTSCTT